MTFGTFAGMAAAFPMMIKSLYVPLESDLDPLKFAFYGPLVGSATRVFLEKLPIKLAVLYLLILQELHSLFYFQF
jgi:NNP family nitrate/nitrite transporter-like MFS transporter